jgi:CDP-6-deoxy-D-xylo-4-hexulose-3-dehydrase
MTPADRETLNRIVRAEMSGLPTQSHDASTGMPLTVVGFGPDEVLAALDCLLTTRVTMGAEVRAFEAEWAAWCGREQGVMVNSGSSANLLMLEGLVELGRLKRGDEVLVPAVGWSTTLFPIVQAGLVPVIVDVNPASLCMDPASARAAMTHKTRAVMPVHLLGQAADCDYEGLLVLEDACAAHGAVHTGRRIGSLGEAASFSFFFSHHITTVEGGIIVTDDPELADAMRSLRAHGWVRERSDRAALIAAHPDIDSRFLFVSAGYNLRPTDMAGAFGRIQLKRLDAWVARRRANHAEWCAALAGTPGITVFPEMPGTEHAGFAFAMIVEGDRRPLMQRLEAVGIETRPISGSNLVRQPAFQRLLAQGADVRIPGPLHVADRVHEHGFFVGNSHAFGPEHGRLLAGVVRA